MNRNMSQETSPIIVDRSHAVATITLNRPERRNPLSPELLESLFEALDDIEADASIRSIVLTGAGSTFCAGAELGTIIDQEGINGEVQYQLLRKCCRLAQRIRDSELPVIAAVNGAAVGGGAALALACDIAIAATGASYHFAFGRVGAAGGDMGCAYFLQKIVGTARAKYWLLRGASVSSDEGSAAGLFVDVCKPGQLLFRARELAAQIAESGSRFSAAATKRSVARCEDSDYQSFISYEAYVQSFLFTLDDHKVRLRELTRRVKSKAARSD
jgi:enoyl-CoA hydratase/carnithine racemase